ncbi:MAG: Fic family protein [Armatimonadota bacterium]|nr:Fic family protein [Armatimonadota bacterium]
MRKSFQNTLPEIFVSTTESSRTIHDLVKAGRARKIGPRLYTRNMQDSDVDIVGRNNWLVIKGLFPEHVISHRTAIEMKPTAQKTIFLTGAYPRALALPGLRVRVLPGPGPLDGDTIYLQDLWLASRPRAYLECLKTKKVRGTESPAISEEQIEAKLEELLRLYGAEAANRFRDQARKLAPLMDAQQAFERLNSIVGTLMGTHHAALHSPAARAFAAGEPYDPRRLKLFQVLKDELLLWNTIPQPDQTVAGVAFSNLAFVDAYFSNFIEGTEFRIDEAVDIVFHGYIPNARPADAHDVLGTFQVVSSLAEMGQSATTLDFPAFITKLQRIHTAILSGRGEKNPGQFKEKENRAGATEFVLPELVQGTLRLGLELLKGFAEPFQAAVFVMFLIAEVHPFDDGNGRLARAMANAELIAGSQRRIFIPNVYREDYLSALRAMTHNQNPKPLLRMLYRAQEFSARIAFTDLKAALVILENCNAFSMDTTLTLRMPGSS